MISKEYTWSEVDSYTDKSGNVFAGFVSLRSNVTLKLDTMQVKQSKQLEGDSLRVHYLCPTIARHFGEVVEHELDTSIKGKPIAIDRYQLLKIKDVNAINKWLEAETIDKILEKCL